MKYTRVHLNHANVLLAGIICGPREGAGPADLAASCAQLCPRCTEQAEGQEIDWGAQNEQNREDSSRVTTERESCSSLSTGDTLVLCTRPGWGGEETASQGVQRPW